MTALPDSVIYLRDITKLERTDFKPYCILLETKDKEYYLALKDDDEIYGWLDDVYSRSPLMDIGNPTNFIHRVHVSFDPISKTFIVSPTSL
jgi:serine/threonine-protein kinase CLA4